MPQQFNPSPSRRAYLLGIGATATVFTGCLGDDDSDIDDTTDDADDTDDTDDSTDDDPIGSGNFAIQEFWLEPDTLELGDTFDATADIINTQSDTGAQDILLLVDDGEVASEALTLEGLSDDELTFADISTDDLEDGETYDVTVQTENDEESLSLTIEEAIYAEVTTLDATSISASGATLEGDIDSNGDDLTVWFEYGLAGEDLEDETETDSPFRAGSFSINVSDLEAETTYEFKAVGTANGNRDEGDVLEFETGSPGAVVHHWALDDDDDTVVDSVGNEDGTVSGDLNWVEGNYYGGYALERSENGHVEFSMLGDWGESMDEDFAIAYTIDPEEGYEGDSTPIGARPGSGGDDPGPTISYTWDWGGIVEGVGFNFNIGDSDNSGTVTDDGVVPADAGPHRIVVNKVSNDPNNWEIYVNGEQVEAGPTGDFSDMNTFSALEVPFRLFVWAIVDDEEHRPFNGVIDNVKLFDGGVTGAIIADDYDEQPWV